MEKKKVYFPDILIKINDIILSKQSLYFVLQSFERCRLFLCEKKKNCKCDLITNCCFICIFQFIEFIVNMVVFDTQLFCFRSSQKYKYNYYFAASILRFSNINCYANLDWSSPETIIFFNDNIKNFQNKTQLYTAFSFKYHILPDDIFINKFERIRSYKIFLAIYYFCLRSNVNTTISHIFRDNLLYFLGQELEKKFIIRDDEEIEELIKSLKEHMENEKEPDLSKIIDFFKNWFNNFKNKTCKNRKF